MRFGATKWTPRPTFLEARCAQLLASFDEFSHEKRSPTHARTCKRTREGASKRASGERANERMSKHVTAQARASKGQQEPQATEPHKATEAPQGYLPSSYVEQASEQASDRASKQTSTHVTAQASELAQSHSSYRAAQSHRNTEPQIATKPQGYKASSLQSLLARGGDGGMREALRIIFSG